MHLTTYFFQTSSMLFLFLNHDIEFEFHGRHVVDLSKIDYVSTPPLCQCKLVQELENTTRMIPTLPIDNILNHFDI
jgi:hypothetical protein